MLIYFHGGFEKGACLSSERTRLEHDRRGGLRALEIS